MPAARRPRGRAVTLQDLPAHFCPALQIQQLNLVSNPGVCQYLRTKLTRGWNVSQRCISVLQVCQLFCPLSLSSACLLPLTLLTKSQGASSSLIALDIFGPWPLLAVEVDAGLHLVIMWSSRDLASLCFSHLTSKMSIIITQIHRVL